LNQPLTELVLYQIGTFFPEKNVINNIFEDRPCRIRPDGWKI
jgi:hypothetical protein